jgi:Ala-tRNA(Pro) deacylase
MYVEAYLVSRGARYERLTHHPVMTAQRLASAEHITGKHVAKPVVVRIDDEYVMCVVPADAQIDLERVAGILGVSTANLATESEMTELFPDCEVGAEPPIGAMYGLPTLMDPRLEGDFYVIFQAGRHTDAIRMRLADFEAVADPMIGPITSQA